MFTGKCQESFNIDFDFQYLKNIDYAMLVFISTQQYIRLVYTLHSIYVTKQL